MMKRMIWLGVGMGLGAAVYALAQRPQSDLSDGSGFVARAKDTVGGLLADFRSGMAEREAELRARHGIEDEAI